MFRSARILSWVLFTAVFASSAISTVIAETNYLPRNLSRGDSGLDVYNLQVILNQDIETRVAIEGVGSLGNETQLFGAATEDAVRRFQLKHASEVLIPAGIETPTGFVGARTREILSKIATKAFGGSSVVSKTTISPPADSSTNKGALSGLDIGDGFESSLLNIFGGDLTNAPVLFSAESQPIVSGKDAYLMGVRLKEGEKYNLILKDSGEIFAEAEARAPNFLTFKPEKNFDSGPYKIYAEDSKGDQSNTITIYLSNTLSPKITRISPSPMPLGKEITIWGNNFTETNNSIVSTSGVIPGLKLEGGKIKFISNFGAEIPENIRPEIGNTGIIVLRVVNSNGASVPVMLNISFEQNP